MEQDVRNIISSKKCSKCGGPAQGWKCAQCGLETEHFNPLHWRECSRGGKLVAKCKACGQAEDNCTCQPR